MHKILIVDDEAYVSTQLEERLTLMGYSVVGRASTGEGSLDMAKSLTPDLILMDIVMPGTLDGIDAARIIKEELDIPIIFLTAYANDKYVERAKDVEPFGYIVKPFREKEIKAVIEMAFCKKAAEDQIKTSLREKEVLLREMYHRVKNNIQVISSLLGLQSMQIKDKAALEMFKESQGRIRTIALIHEKLYRSEDLVHIEFADYVRDLTSYIFATYRGIIPQVSLHIDIKDIFFDINTAIPCAMIINELVSNSLRHAFPKARKGKITITLHSPKTNEYELIVSDDGIGVPGDIDIRTTESQGLRLVTILAEDQLQGQITLDRAKGTTFHITFRVSERQK